MKRIVALSDSHGDVNSLRDALDLAAKRGKIDMVVFLGDGTADFEQVRPSLMKQGIGCHVVRGNNDWGSCEEAEVLFRANGVKFFATHGHMWQVKYGIERLWYAAREREAQVVLYGHTHREKIDLEYGMTLINPGAVCERYGRSRAAFAEIIVEDNGFVNPTLCYWD